MSDIPTPEPQKPYRVFISHSKEDQYVIDTGIKPPVEQAGAVVFVDAAEIKFGDNIPEKIFEQLKACHELIVLCTVTALQRPWIFAEVGATILQSKRVVLIKYGPSDSDLQERGIFSLIGPSKLLKLDDFKAYVQELTARINEHASS